MQYFVLNESALPHVMFLNIKLFADSVGRLICTDGMIDGQCLLFA